MAQRARDRAQSARASEIDGAPGQAVCRAWVSGTTDASTHIGAGGQRWRLSTFEILVRVTKVAPRRHHRRKVSVVQSKPIATQSWRLSAVLGVRTKRHLSALTLNFNLTNLRISTVARAPSALRPMRIGILSSRYRPYGRSPLASWPRLIGVPQDRLVDRRTRIPMRHRCAPQVWRAIRARPT